MTTRAVQPVIGTFVACVVAALSGCARPIERIVISPDNRGFIEAHSHRPFVPWGFNYDRDYRMRLLEDYWATEWSTVERDFREMRRLGANVVRIHLQLARFMEGPDTPNRDALDRLKKLLALARANDLRLDITGLACYRRADVPEWYSQLDEEHRWRAQANFWQAVAETCAGDPIVFCYDLVNEPSVPHEPKKDWLAGELAGFTYDQFITLDPGSRDRTTIAAEWTRKMTAAIRQHDKSTPVTIGLLPFANGTGFDVAALAPELDFVCVHIYPRKSHLDDDVANLKRFAVGKPLIVEEIFPLNCGIDGMQQFIEQSRDFVCGWIGFYWGQSPEELEKTSKIGDTLTAQSLRFFQDPHPAIRNPRSAIPNP
jgi:hypothetical protein